MVRIGNNMQRISRRRFLFDANAIARVLTLFALVDRKEIFFNIVSPSSTRSGQPDVRQVPHGKPLFAWEDWTRSASEYFSGIQIAHTGSEAILMADPPFIDLSNSGIDIGTLQMTDCRSRLVLNVERIAEFYDPLNSRASENIVVHIPSWRQPRVGIVTSVSYDECDLTAALIAAQLLKFECRMVAAVITPMYQAQGRFFQDDGDGTANLDRKLFCKFVERLKRIVDLLLIMPSNKAAAIQEDVYPGSPGAVKDRHGAQCADGLATIAYFIAVSLSKYSLSDLDIRTFVNTCKAGVSMPPREVSARLDQLK